MSAGDGTTLLTMLTGTPSSANPSTGLFSGQAADDDGTICVVAQTSIGRHVFDRAPDTGCLLVGTGPGGQAFH